MGTVPFGYGMAADGLHLEADPAEQGILSRIRELKAASYTTRRIADELNSRDSPPGADSAAVSVCGGSTPGGISYRRRAVVNEHP